MRYVIFKRPPRDISLEKNSTFFDKLIKKKAQNEQFSIKKIGFMIIYVVKIVQKKFFGKVIFSLKKSFSLRASQK